MGSEESTFGRVKRIDMTDSAGFPFGIILIQDTSGERHELRYVRESTGDIPAFNDYVEVVYSGNQIISIRIVDKSIGDEKFHDFDEEQKITPEETMSRLWLIPVAYFWITGILLIVSIMIESVSIIMIVPSILFFITGLLVFRPTTGLVFTGYTIQRITSDDQSEEMPANYNRGLFVGTTGFSSGILLIMIGLGTSSAWDSSLLFLNLGALLGFLGIPLSFLIILIAICWHSSHP